MYAESFPSRLKKAREEAGYTQAQISKITGIDRTALSKYERGLLQPDIEKIGTLADFYEVSTDWLIGTRGRNK